MSTTLKLTLTLLQVHTQMTEEFYYNIFNKYNCDNYNSP